MREQRFLLLGEKARMRAVFFFSPTIFGFMGRAGFFPTFLPGLLGRLGRDFP
jgi:hypothetical protein